MSRLPDFHWKGTPDDFQHFRVATVHVFASAMSHRELIKIFFTLQEERVKAYKTFDRLVINLDYRPTHLSEVYPTQNVSKMENITSHNLRKIRVLKYL